MKIFGICLVKDEEDIIEEVLLKALTWCDYIFVYDNGSIDKTWEIVKELNINYSNIILYKKERKPFRDELRAEVFNHYRHMAKKGDWWCRLDSDEIYIDNPREFLKKINPLHHVVFNESYQYYFTDKDYEKWQNDSTYFSNTSNHESLLKYYKCNWSEIRFFKYRKNLVWDNGSWPHHVGIVSPKRIRLKHLQYRSPVQMEKRLKNRKIAIEEGYTPFTSYNSEKNWLEKVIPSSTLYFDNDSGAFIMNEKDLPPYLEPLYIRILKYILHFTKIFP
jgi:hypothetical protein